MSGATQPWFADGALPFDRRQPYFYNIEDFPWVQEVQSHWEVIRDEMLANLAADATGMVPYVNREMTSRPEKWKTLGLMFWSLRSKENCRRFPRTWNILRRIPNLTAASLNLLEEHTTIKPHVGNTDAIIRCHMGLVVPAPAPRCAFRVGDEIRSWTEGGILMFCDAHEHTAWNNTDQQRYILVVDIMRPEFLDQRASISSRVLASIYHETAYQRSDWLRRYLGGPPFSLPRAAVPEVNGPLGLGLRRPRFAVSAPIASNSRDMDQMTPPAARSSARPVIDRVGATDAVPGPMGSTPRIRFRVRNKRSICSS